MKIYSIRGATTIETNSKDNIIENAKILLQEIITQNNIVEEDIINIIFSATKDVTKAYPAICTRNMGINSTPIMCVQEMNVDESLNMCIRIMLTTYLKNNNVQHIYLKEAKKLRPDIYFKSGGVNIAIDGPAGSGKSTVAKSICSELNFTYIDTGAMFRCVMLYCIKNNINIQNEVAVNEILDNINIFLEFKNKEQKIYLNDKDVTLDIRTPEISKNVSIIAKIPNVRDKLLKMQRKIAKDKNVIMDGRDIGTKVLPNAIVKIYLDANINERINRRYNELIAKGEEIDYNELKIDIINRDFMDMNREKAPLKKAIDAISINTTNLNLNEVCQQIIKIIKEKI